MRVKTEEGTPDFYQLNSESRQLASHCKQESLTNSTKAAPFYPDQNNQFQESNYTFRPNSRHYAQLNNLQNSYHQIQTPQIRTLSSTKKSQPDTGKIIVQSKPPYGCSNQITSSGSKTDCSVDGSAISGFTTNQYGEPLPCMNLSLIPEYATVTSTGDTSVFKTYDELNQIQQIPSSDISQYGAKNNNFRTLPAESAQYSKNTNAQATRH